jgi:uncharacterized protein (TIGR04540 family)
MEILMYPITVKMLAGEIIRACDAYTSRQISKDDLKNLIMHYACNYPRMLL